MKAGLFCRTSSSVRLWWEFKALKGPKGTNASCFMPARPATSALLLRPQGGGVPPAAPLVLAALGKARLRRPAPGLVRHTPSRVSGPGSCAPHAFERVGPLARSERKQGFSAEQVPVSAYVGSSKNLQDLKGSVHHTPPLVLCTIRFRASAPSGSVHHTPSSECPLWFCAP